MSKTYHPAALTWRWKSGILTWTCEVSPPAAGTSRDALVGLATGVVGALGDFACATHVSWATQSRGEDALEQALAENATQVLASADLIDPTDLSINLDLKFTEPALGDMKLENAGRLWLVYEPEGPVLSITLFLEVDLYAWRSWGRERDNRATAELNAPKLRGFLERLQRDLGAKVVDIDAQDYPGQVDEFGFHPPKDETC